MTSKKPGARKTKAKQACFKLTAAAKIRSYYYIKYIFVILVLIIAFPAKAAEIMEIPEGITEIDFDGDGTKEIIVKAWRGNFNAHGFYMISVYKEDGGRLLLIPNHDNPIFRTLHTADCTARDYFFLKQSNNIHLIEVMPQNSQTRFLCPVYLKINRAFLVGQSGILSLFTRTQVIKNTVTCLKL